MFMLKVVFVFGVLAVSLRNVRAVSSEEKQKFYAGVTSQIEECRVQLGVSVEEIKKAESTSYATLDPCLKACVYKKNDMIDVHGLYDADKAAEFIKKYLSEEADEKKAIEIISKCKTVNECKVTDREKSCERSALLFECLLPLKAMFDN